MEYVQIVILCFALPIALLFWMIGYMAFFWYWIIVIGAIGWLICKIVAIRSMKRGQVFAIRFLIVQMVLGWLPVLCFIFVVPMVFHESWLYFFQVMTVTLPFSLLYLWEYLVAFRHVP